MNLASFSASPTSIDAETLMMSLPALETEIEADFKRLPPSPVFSTSVADSQEASKKNRWKEFVPYDHNRVNLNSYGYTLNDDKDYINASFIRGFSTNDGYIATQGPMLGTVDDFWRMVWAENCRVVVMMSRTVEGYQTRSYKYWPDPGDSLEAGQLTISTEWEDERSTHATRKFVVVHGKTCEARTVTQLQFLCWPEDVSYFPCIPTFLGFWNEFRKISKEDRLPVVHCSNGSLRSSLFIGLDVLCKQLNNTGRVDIYCTTRRLREDRTMSVNSLDQFIFLHYCVVEACFRCCPSMVTEKAVIKGSYRNTGKMAASRTYSLDVSAKSSAPNNKGSSTNRFRKSLIAASQIHSPVLEEDPVPYKDVKPKLSKKQQSTARMTCSSSPNSVRRQWISSRHKLEKIAASMDPGKKSKKKSEEEIIEEYKILSSHQALWNRLLRSSEFFSQSEIESKTIEERNGNVYRGSSKVWIPIDNNSVPVTCIPLNRSSVTTTIAETTPSRLKHSLSLQNNTIMSQISGILPAENKKSFLVSSFMTLTSSDFWQVMFDTGCLTAVRILPELNLKKMSDFPLIETDNFSVSFESVSNLRPDIIETVFLMKPAAWATNQGQDHNQTIKVLNLSGLPVDAPALSCDLMSYVFQLIDTWLEHTFTSLVHVQCSDGLAPCGFFCAGYNIVSNIKASEEADVYMTCRTVQNMIPDAISQEEYNYLYEMSDQCATSLATNDPSASHPNVKDKRQVMANSSLESRSSTE